MEFSGSGGECGDGSGECGGGEMLFSGRAR